MRGAGHVASKGERKPEGKRHMVDPDVDGGVILRWILRNWDGAWTGLIWLRNRDRWRVHAKAVMNLRVPFNAGNFLTR